VNDFLAVNMPNDNRQELDFNQLPIPFRCVATDLNSLETLLCLRAFATGRARLHFIPASFRRSRAATATTLSMAESSTTCHRRSQHDLHADVIIAVHLDDAALSSSDITSIVGVLNRALMPESNAMSLRPNGWQM